jgi:quercetin dioxygenase-like cupin family protein
MGEVLGLSRPTAPMVIRYADVPRMLWGDDTSGQVIDWLYPTSDKLHFTAFSMRPGAFWRHSEAHKPVYGADEGFYVLQGSLTMHNPETGEVVVANAGETLHFGKDTWHYGYNFTSGETIVLEAFAPVPPEAVFSVAGLAAAAPPLRQVRGGRYELMDGWPANADVARQDKTLWVLRPADWLHLIRGEKTPVRVSLFVATQLLTMGCFTLLPGVTADPETHPGDEVAVVTTGCGHVYLPESEQLFELHERDACFLPEGTHHQYYNLSDQPATIVFGVAPLYR